MTSVAILNAFREAMSEVGGGILAHFDLADTRRRNDYLGFSVVDHDINELTAMLENYGPPIKISARTSGDKWAALLVGTDASLLTDLLARYKRQQPVIVGWQALARKRFRWSRKRDSTRNATLSRCLRCVYASINSTDELLTKWQLIDEKIRNAQVDCATDISTGFFQTDCADNPRWRCIEDKVEPQSCPFCGKTTFDWCDGDTTVFGAFGNCRGCGAEVEFKDFFQLIEP